MHRFFIPPESWNDDPPALGGTEANHCANTLRCQPGDTVMVFNGQGAEATARIESASARQVTLRMLGKSQVPALPARVTLAQAVPKGKTMDWIVRMATELGAHTVAPVLSERTVVRLDGENAPSKQGKWRQVAIEACKQCGRAWTPAIREPARIESVLETNTDHDLALIASLQPDSRRIDDVLDEFRSERGGPPESVLVLVGPEGDYTPAEMALARSSGCRPVSLGPIVLRAETAAVYVLSVLGNALFTRASG